MIDRRFDEQRSGPLTVLANLNPSRKNKESRAGARALEIRTASGVMPAMARLTLFSVLLFFSSLTGAAAWAQSTAITITLTGQSMIRSDIRATAPAEVPVIQGLLKGDIKFTNLESAVAEKG